MKYLATCLVIFSGMLSVPSIVQARVADHHKEQNPVVRVLNHRHVKEIGLPNPVEVALEDARRYWNTTEPCGGNYLVIETYTLPEGFEGAGAWVSFETPLGHDNFNAAPSTYTACGIYLYMEAKGFSGARLWSPYSEGLYNWPLFCQTIVHEYGHFLSHPDENQPGTEASVEHGRFTGANEPWTCGKPPWEGQEDIGWGKTSER